MTAPGSYIVHSINLISMILVILGLTQIGTDLYRSRVGFRFFVVGFCLILVVSSCFMSEVRSDLVLLGWIFGGMLGLFWSMKFSRMVFLQGMGSVGLVFLLLSHDLTGKILFSPTFPAPPLFGFFLILGVITGAMALGCAMVMARGSSRSQLKSQMGLQLTRYSQGILVIIIVLQAAIYCQSPYHSGHELFMVLILSLFFGIRLALPMRGVRMPVFMSGVPFLWGFSLISIGILFHQEIILIAGALSVSFSIVFFGKLSQLTHHSLKSLLWDVHLQDPLFVQRQEVAETQISFADPTRVIDVLQQAHRVVLVPGEGMVASKSYYLVGQLVHELQLQQARVHTLVHPLAGRSVGHLNWLLTEAGIGANSKLSLEQGDDELRKADVVLVIGADDSVNASHDLPHESALWGMHPLNVGLAKQVFIIKRSTGPGFSGETNPLLIQKNVSLVQGDAYSILKQIVLALSKRAKGVV